MEQRKHKHPRGSLGIPLRWWTVIGAVLAFLAFGERLQSKLPLALLVRGGGLRQRRVVWLCGRLVLLLGNHYDLW
jgi:hypothetical protein